MSRRSICAIARIVPVLSALSRAETGEAELFAPLALHRRASGRSDSESSKSRQPSRDPAPPGDPPLWTLEGGVAPHSVRASVGGEGGSDVGLVRRLSEFLPASSFLRSRDSRSSFASFITATIRRYRTPCFVRMPLALSRRSNTRPKSVVSRSRRISLNNASRSAPSGTRSNRLSRMFGTAQRKLTPASACGSLGKFGAARRSERCHALPRYRSTDHTTRHRARAKRTARATNGLVERWAEPGVVRTARFSSPVLRSRSPDARHGPAESLGTMVR